MSAQQLSEVPNVTSRQRAEDAAAELLSATWARDGVCHLPVDPFHVAESLGLRVSFVSLDREVSGMLAKRPHRDAEVYINAFDGRNRQRFSCAHEIGHYNERASDSDDESWGYIDRRGPSSGTGDNPSEIFANQFAAALLMPDALVRERHERALGPAAMAVDFGVSLEAMNHRIENLGL